MNQHFFQIKDYFPWILMSLFTIEGVTGMIPAINSDVDPNWNRCDFSRSKYTSLSHL